MSDIISQLAERLSPEEMEELAALLLYEAGDKLTFVIEDPITHAEVDRMTVKLNRNDGTLEGLGLVRTIIFDL